MQTEMTSMSTAAAELQQELNEAQDPLDYREQQGDGYKAAISHHKCQRK